MISTPLHSLQPFRVGAIEIVEVASLSADRQASMQALSANEDLDDLIGPVLDQVLPHVRWDSTGKMIEAAAFDGDVFVALGWAEPVAYADGRAGVNLSYAVARSHRGRQLAELTTSFAFRVLEARLPVVGQAGRVVSVQTLAANPAAIGVARKLGLETDVGLAFSCETTAGPRSYVGLSVDAAQFSERCRQSLVMRAPAEAVAAEPPDGDASRPPRQRG